MTEEYELYLKLLTLNLLALTAIMLQNMMREEEMEEVLKKKEKRPQGSK